MNILDGIPEDKLSMVQEAQLLQAGDRVRLIAHNTIEAFHYGKGCYQSNELSEGEVLSAAYDGLTAAAKNWKPGHYVFFPMLKRMCVAPLAGRRVRTA